MTGLSVQKYVVPLGTGESSLVSLWLETVFRQIRLTHGHPKD